MCKYSGESSKSTQPTRCDRTDLYESDAIRKQDPERNEKNGARDIASVRDIASTSASARMIASVSARTSEQCTAWVRDE